MKSWKVQGVDNERRDKRRRVQGTGAKDMRMHSKQIFPLIGITLTVSLSLSTECLISE